MRPIQYPINRSQGLEYDTGIGNTADNPFTWQTSDNDELVSITLTLSLNEYVALASAIDVGRDIAYGGASLAIWWIWVRSINPMAFCDQVDNCITTNLTTQIAINNTLLSNGIVNPDQIQPVEPQMNNRFPSSSRNQDVSTPPASCDKDKLWTGTLEMVTRLDDLARDFLEGVIASNDKAERVANVIDIVPIFGDIAADIITLFTDVAPDLLNAYNAHSSVIQLEENACSLFELVCNECRYPTYDEMFSHYSNLGISGVEDLTNYGVTAAMDFMIGSNGLANAVVWYTAQSVALYTLYLGATYANRRGTKWLSIWANIGEDAPNNGWELLCSGCQPQWCYETDFTTGSKFGTYANNTDEGTWNGFGWNDSDLGSGQHSVLTIRLDFPTPAYVTSVEVWYEITGANFDNIHQIQESGNPASKNISGAVGIRNPTVTFDRIFNTGVQIALHDANIAPNVNYTKMRILGEGANPFGSDNC